jgi:hypothetical protein
LDIFEEQKFCQDTLIQTELTNPKGEPLDHPQRRPIPKKTKEETFTDIYKGQGGDRRTLAQKVAINV